MEDIRLTFSELRTYIILFNILLGVLFGVMPLIAGLVLKNVKLAVIGLVVSIVGGAILGVFLSFPISAIFLFFIVRGRSESQPTVEPDINVLGPGDAIN